MTGVNNFIINMHHFPENCKYGTGFPPEFCPRAASINADGRRRREDRAFGEAEVDFRSAPPGEPHETRPRRMEDAEIDDAVDRVVQRDGPSR